jgi:hypothetical protein
MFSPARTEKTSENKLLQLVFQSVFKVGSSHYKSVMLPPDQPA